MGQHKASMRLWRHQQQAGDAVGVTGAYGHRLRDRWAHQLLQEREVWRIVSLLPHMWDRNKIGAVRGGNRTQLRL